MKKAKKKKVKKKGANKGDYKVGDCKPPKEHQIKKGEVRNPNGTPKGPRLGTILKKMMKDINPKTGRPYEKDFVLATLLHGMKGNAPMNKEIWNRIDGKIEEKIAINTDPIEEKLDDMDAEQIKRELANTRKLLKKIKNDK